MKRKNIMFFTLIFTVLSAISYRYIDNTLVQILRHNHIYENKILKVATWIGSPTLHVTGSFLAWVFCYMRVGAEKAVIALRWTTSQMISLFIVQVMKPICGRMRPLANDSAEGFVNLTKHLYSLPSSHSVVLFSLAITLSIHKPKCTPWFILAAIVISTGRILTLEHYMSDVLIGGAIAAMVSFILSSYRLYPSNKDLNETGR